MTATATYKVTGTVVLRDGSRRRFAQTVEAEDRLDALYTVRSMAAKRGVKVRGSEARKVTVRRSREEIQAAREALLAQIGADWQRVPEGANASDVAALVKAGALEEDVRREWDQQGGSSAHAYFGGAGVCQRLRRYVRRTG